MTRSHTSILLNPHAVKPPAQLEANGLPNRHTTVKIVHMHQKQSLKPLAWILLIIILVIAAGLRFYNLNWDNGIFAHPDERSTVAFYAPIKVQDLCLNCHGQPGTDIKAADYDLIKKLYPEDEAVGYKSGDLRGMWSIRFEK